MPTMLTWEEKIKFVKQMALKSIWHSFGNCFVKILGMNHRDGGYGNDVIVFYEKSDLIDFQSFYSNNFKNPNKYTWFIDPDQKQKFQCGYFDRDFDLNKIHESELHVPTINVVKPTEGQIKQIQLQMTVTALATVETSGFCYICNKSCNTKAPSEIRLCRACWGNL